MLTITRKVWLINKYQKQIREVKMKFNQIGIKKVKAVRDLRHDQARESLSASAQFNCEGCNG